jgi:pimeloyl-ACP methyl ester carboxylesterase
MRRIGPLIVRRIQSSGEELIRTAWHNPSKIDAETWAAYRKPLRAENWDRALWELTAASTESDLAERLSQLRLPVLVITGDDDRIVPTEDSLRLAEELPNAELRVLANCGHLPQEECPEAFMGAVANFIQGIE